MTGPQPRALFATLLAGLLTFFVLEKGAILHGGPAPAGHAGHAHARSAWMVLAGDVGDFVVLLNAGFSRTRAYLFNLLCSAMGLAGAVLGYLTLGRAGNLVPYVVTFASAGFLYVAISHLMPALQRKDTLRDSVPQLALIAVGVLGVYLLID